MQAKCLLAGQKPGMAYNKTHTWLGNQNFDRYFCIISLNTMETWKLSWLHWQHKLIPSPLFLRSFCSGFVSCSQVPCGQNTIQFYAKMLQITLLLMPSIKAGLPLFTLFLSLDKKWCRCKGKTVKTINTMCVVGCTASYLKSIPSPSFRTAGNISNAAMTHNWYR